MKKLFFLLLIPLVIVNLFIIYNIFHKVPMVTIGTRVFYVETAKTTREQEIGLAKYTSLAENKAMYFPFDRPDYYVFWMKGMHFPIDILFLKNNTIVTIFPSVSVPEKDVVELPTYKTLLPADGVLEINAGLSEKYGFKVGNTVDFVE